MHWTTHVITGAAAGYLIGRPVPAAITGFACHPVLDFTPHHDPDADLGYVLDAVAGCSALAFLMGSRRVREADARRAALWGAVGSGLPDTELLVKLFKDVETEDYVFPWHNGTLPHRQTLACRSTASQVGLVCAMLFLVWLKRRRWVKRCGQTP